MGISAHASKRGAVHAGVPTDAGRRRAVHAGKRSFNASSFWHVAVRCVWRSCQESRKHPSTKAPKQPLHIAPRFPKG